jgi:Protein of unknown function, DUF547
MRNHISLLSLPLGLIVIVLGVSIFVGCDYSDAPRAGINYHTELAKKPHTPESATGTIHQPFDDLLRKHVSKQGLVNYVTLATDTAKLTAYIDALLASPPASGKPDEETAYWINAYNAAALNQVLAASPAITNITTSMLAKPVFGSLSLKQIREEKLMAKLHDPRIHTALSFGAKGCPALANTAFLAADLDWRLNNSTVNFFTDRKRNWINPTSDIIHYSGLVKMYRDDFGSGSREIRLWVARYVTPPFSRYLKNNVPSKVVYNDFDWQVAKK